MSQDVETAPSSTGDLLGNRETEYPTALGRHFRELRAKLQHVQRTPPIGCFSLVRFIACRLD